MIKSYACIIKSFSFSALVLLVFSSSLAQTSSCLDILPNPDSSSPAFQEFDRYIEVLGCLKFYAEPGVSDSKLLHAASIGAELLDNDENGIIDDDSLGTYLASVNAVMPIFNEEGSLAEIAMMENEDGPFCLHAVLYADEVSPNNPLNWFEEASLEEILHTINGCGHVDIYPNTFALSPPGASQLAQSMDIARGGQFLGVPGSYPEEAWFHYSDVTCDYECMEIEYLYWALASNMGVLNTPDICEAIDEEWELCSPELLESVDVMIHTIITDPDFSLPQNAPNGIYCPNDGVFEVSKFESPVVFPNPASSSFSIALNSLVAKVDSFKIYDSSGREVYSENVDSSQSELKVDSKLERGIYLISLFSHDAEILFSSSLVVD
ncbi:MAG TPA: T9SS type A sorting domain-containing protein [Flavobacteriales bacterium]|jgi:hypothetical protein|nr:T9SS type A sorting domain-containing protein [Flavobacteriales bacterium]HIO15668.1 T9SS type A sorting domain-containing protein [Flavobacteriales bacterium]